jgi:hypothetical protein
MRERANAKLEIGLKRRCVACAAAACSTNGEIAGARAFP